MTKRVCAEAVLKCTFGSAPGNLMVLPDKNALVNSKPAANIMDNKPLLNIPCFGACASMANPAVAAAKALNPAAVVPCVGAFPAPWFPGNATLLLKNQPVLTDSSKLICVFEGEISIQFAGQTTVNTN